MLTCLHVNTKTILKKGSLCDYYDYMWCFFVFMEFKLKKDVRAFEILLLKADKK